MDITQPLEQLYKKLQQVIQQHTQLQKENKQLRQKLAHTQQKNETLTTQILTVQQKLDALQIINNQLDEADKKDIEKRINQYIKDIDKCIEAMHKQ